MARPASVASAAAGWRAPASRGNSQTPVPTPVHLRSDPAVSRPTPAVRASVVVPTKASAVRQRWRRAVLDVPLLPKLVLADLVDQLRWRSS